MVLTALRQTGEPPLRVSAQDLRLMQKSDMTEIYRGFVAKAAPLIVVADDDLNSEAGLELQVSFCNLVRGIYNVVMPPLHTDTARKTKQRASGSSQRAADVYVTPTKGMMPENLTPCPGKLVILGN